MNVDNRYSWHVEKTGKVKRIQNVERLDYKYEPGSESRGRGGAYTGYNYNDSDQSLYAF